MLVRDEACAGAAPIWFVTKETWPRIRDRLPESAQAFASACGFEPTPGRSHILPGPDGEIAASFSAIEGAAARARDLFLPGQLATSLPPGLYRFANRPHDRHARRALLAALGLSFPPLQNRWRRVARGFAFRTGSMPRGSSASRAAVELGRDLINTPANDMDPEALEAAAITLAAQHLPQAGSHAATRFSRQICRSFTPSAAPPKRSRVSSISALATSRSRK